MIIQIVGSVLIFFVVCFVAFAIRATIIWSQLSSVASRLRRLSKVGDKNPGPVFATNKTLSHLWTEFRDTLHEQREFDSSTGELKPSVMRSTVPAAMVFTTETLIDSRLLTEFFKHLPGLLPASASSAHSQA